LIKEDEKYKEKDKRNEEINGKLFEKKIKK
jgi:hypothetical protein